MVEGVVGDLVAGFVRAGDGRLVLVSLEVGANGEERERQLLVVGEREQTGQRDVVDRGQTWTSFGRDTVDGEVVGDLVEIDADGAEAHDAYLLYLKRKSSAAAAKRAPNRGTCPEPRMRQSATSTPAGHV